MRDLLFRSSPAILIGLSVILTSMRVTADDLKSFDIRPFALPNTPANEVRFEDPREIDRVVVTFTGKAPDQVGLSYLQKTWPGSRIEQMDPTANPHGMGWYSIDDSFNAAWKDAAIKTERLAEAKIAITFKGLAQEYPDLAFFDVTYRRTLGVRVDTNEPGKIESIEVFTRSQPAASGLRVLLDAGTPTPTRHVKLAAYNAVITRVEPEAGVTADGNSLALPESGARAFRVELAHMAPGRLFSNDEGMLTFEMDDDTFTISVESLASDGPIWFADEGVLITKAGDNTSLEEYKAGCRGRRSYSRLVAREPEQSLGGATNGQPNPHPVAYQVGCKHSWQRFWIEPSADIVLARYSDPIPLIDRYSSRLANDAEGRFFFGLEKWISTGRFTDPAPVMVYNIHKKSGEVAVEQKTLAVPLTAKLTDRLVGNDNVVCLVRFRFTNLGGRPVTAELPIAYSNKSSRSENRLSNRNDFDGNLVPHSKRDKLTLAADRITSRWREKDVLRCIVATAMRASESGDGVVLRKELAPGASCEAVLRIPYIALEGPEELAALRGLDFDRSYAQVRDFWRAEGRRGAQLASPEPNLNALYTAHLAHVDITDFRMPDDPELINTSVGTSTYTNYCNESCMIIQELDERGLHDEARARLAVWLKYQGTVGLRGNFTDHDGVFFGCGGFEGGDSYDQHHGWVLWCLAQHYFLTGDDAWLASIADKMVKGVDWVARQRRVTMQDLPHSRGWERGWLAAGPLEDVDDYFYWLSTNSLTWRGVDAAARALEAINHPEAARVRKEADDYKAALIRGFELSRQHAPLVRLRDGRWVPTYPSRLYHRGRDIGWIREVLEGSVYLLISGLYDVNSKQAQWILDDYQDNRYMSPLYGYQIPIAGRNWFDYIGFSNQPNLLAGLMPYLDRDEPELYIWMFFNAWAACYREEINAMVEHPQPCLGFSNTAQFKTSDESNAVKWLRYMYVYALGDTLHLGRAIPRQWLSDGNTIYAEKVATRFGEVSVRYVSHAAAGKIDVEADLALRRQPGKILVRIRHPEKLPIKSVTVNGKPWEKFDAARGDIDVTGLAGRVTLEAVY